LYNKIKTVLICYPAGKAGNSFTVPDSVTIIENPAFWSARITSVTIPASVTSIKEEAFAFCDSLTSVTFQGTITSANFGTYRPFPGDLRAKYLAGGIGTYTRPNGTGTVWTKQ